MKKIIVCFVALLALGCSSERPNDTLNIDHAMDVRWQAAMIEAADDWFGAAPEFRREIVIGGHPNVVEVIDFTEAPCSSSAIACQKGHYIYLPSYKSIAPGLHLRIASHELGHWLGLGHQPKGSDSVMSDGIDGPNRPTWIDIRSLRELD